MAKLIEGVKLSKEGDIYIRKQFRKLSEYELHLITVANAMEEERRRAEKSGGQARKLTISETTLRDKIDGKIESMYRAFDDAVEIAPPQEREFLRNKVRSRLVYNEQPLFYERPNELLEKCVERAKLFGLAYLVPKTAEKILDDVSDDKMHK